MFVLLKKLKGIIMFLVCVWVALMSTGCTSEEQAILANRTNQIPQDGVIEREVFEGIKVANDIGIFNGSNNSINFQWLFVGNMIEEPRIENLMVNFSNARTAEVREAQNTEYVQEFSFVASEGINGSPSLTIYFSVPWDVEAVFLYDHGAGEIIREVNISNSPNGIVSFTPHEFSGLFHLIGIRDLDEAMADDESGEVTDIATFLGLDRGGFVYHPSGGGLGGFAPHGGGSSGGVSPNRGGGGMLGRPRPVDTVEQVINEEVQLTATLSISVATLVNNMDMLDEPKRPLVPSDGWVMRPRTVTFSEGESVFDVLLRETRASGIHMEFSFFPVFDSVYVRGIHNLYEFDGGPLSGWVYKVNGWGPNFGASRYILQQSDVIEWHYTIDLGRDVGVYVGDM